MDPTFTTPWDTARTIAATALGVPAESAVVRDRLVELNMEVWKRQFKYCFTTFQLCVSREGTFWAPPGYGPIYRVNSPQGRPTYMINQHFQFHLNGTGGIAWQAFADAPKMLRSVAVLPAPFTPFWLSVASDGPEARDASVFVSGTDPNASPVFTHVRSTIGTGVDRREQVTRINGMAIPISGGVDNTPVDAAGSVQLWADLTRVNKPTTNHTVTLLAHDMEGKRTHVLAEMKPFTTSTRYVEYAAPRAWAGQNIYGLFRLDPPTAPSDVVLVSEPSIIRAMVRALYTKQGGTITAEDEGRQLVARAMADWAETLVTATPDDHSPTFEVDTRLFERDTL